MRDRDGHQATNLIPNSQRRIWREKEGFAVNPKGPVGAREAEW